MLVDKLSFGCRWAKSSDTTFDVEPPTTVTRPLGQPNFQFDLPAIPLKHPPNFGVSVFEEVSVGANARIDRKAAFSAAYHAAVKSAVRYLDRNRVETHGDVRTMEKNFEAL